VSAAWCYVLRPARTELLTAPSDDDTAALRAHVDYLRGLLVDGRLVLAGPSPAGAATFGIVVLETDEENARRTMAADPAVASGIMTARLQPFRVTFLRGRDG
jgi:uncharacterized protein YciI